jgi:Family of unknown function (DUF6171)
MSAVEWLRNNVPGMSQESKQMAKARFDVCKQCPKLTPVTGQCKECGCIMPVKVFRKSAFCPLSKWGSTE